MISNAKNPLTENELKEKPDEKKKQRFRKFFISCFVFFIILLIIAGFFISSLFSRFLVSGNSMEPNFQNNTSLIISALPYISDNPKSGDVIVFKLSENTEVDYVKRIIGIPGDVVKIENGKVFLNNTELNEPYIKGNYTYGSQEVILRENEYFVLGDNREANASEDSRILGPIKREQIKGKAWKEL